MKGHPSDPHSPAGQEIVYSLSEEETEDFGRRLGSHLNGGELILLIGPLGAGKTVFVRGIAQGLDIDPEEVSSPTFVLVTPHDGRLTLYHADLYRLDNPEEVFGLGIEESLASGGVVAVEWGEKLPADLREGAIEVRFQDLGEGSRKLTVNLVKVESDS